MRSSPRVCTLGLFINPRYSTWSVSVSVCLSVTTFSAATRNETMKERYQKVQHYTGLILDLAIFVKAMRLRVMAWKTKLTSQYAI